jgi:hypothetical protein
MLKEQIQNDMKDAMRAKDKARLGVVRLILAAVKQREVDERIELTDSDVLVVLDKMVKQRRDSISQYEAAKRQDLADQEKYELGVIQAYLPAAMSDEEIDQLISEAIAQTGASSAQDMGKIMAYIKPKAQGRCDMGAVSGKIKARLSGK